MNVVINVQATQVTRNETFFEVSNQRFQRLKQHEEREKAKWEDVINIGDKYKKLPPQNH